MNVIQTTESSIQIRIKACGALSMLGFMHELSKMEVFDSRKIVFYVNFLLDVKINEEIAAVTRHYPNSTIEVYSYDSYKTK